MLDKTFTGHLPGWIIVWMTFLMHFFIADLIYLFVRIIHTCVHNTLMCIENYDNDY